MEVNLPDLAMYLDHFSLVRRPFALTPDPSFMIWTEQHAAILRELQSEVLNHGSLTVLAGDVGCGKTTLLHALLQDPVIETQCRTVRLYMRIGSASELLHHLLVSFTKSAPECSEDEAFSLLTDHFASTTSQGLQPLIVVDEAQTMSVDAALLLARLAADTTTNSQGPSILFVGQTELTTIIARPELTEFRARITKRLSLGPLSREEVSSFVQGRLEAAGFAGGSLFDAEAVDVIHRYARGVPRLINKACDLCLYTAARQGHQKINAEFASDVLTQFEALIGLPEGSSNIAPLDETPDEDPRLPAADLPDRMSGNAANMFDADGTATAQLEISGIRHAGEDGATKKILPASDVGSASPARSAAVPRPDAPGHYLRRAALVAVCATPVLIYFSLSQQREISVANIAPMASEISVEPSRSVPGGDDQSETSLDEIARGDVALKEMRSRIAQAEAKLTSLNTAISRTEVEKAALDAALQVDRAETEQAKSSLSDTKAALTALERETEAERTGYTELKSQIERAQEELRSIRERTAIAEQDLAGLNFALEDQKAAEAYAWSLLSDLDLAQGTIAPTAQMLEPMKQSIEGNVGFFDAAISASDPRDVSINFARAAIRGHVRAAFYLGQLFETGDGLTRNAEVAQRWYGVAEDSSRMHDASVVSDDFAGVQQQVAPLAAIVSGKEADFVWQGQAREFTVEMARPSGEPVAFARTPLTAMRVRMPEGITRWRVKTDDGSTFGWQPIEHTPE